MTYFPPESDVVWPDGKRKRRPKDGERFIHNGRTYEWDEVIERWVNERGEIARFDKEEDDMYQYGFDGYGDGFSQYQEPKKSAEKTEGEKLRDFFFPKNIHGCECGAWITGSPKHSEGCKLYRRNDDENS
jgi:hypothetical protein